MMQTLLLCYIGVIHKPPAGGLLPLVLANSCSVRTVRKAGPYGRCLPGRFTDRPYLSIAGGSSVCSSTFGNFRVSQAGRCRDRIRSDLWFTTPKIRFFPSLLPPAVIGPLVAVNHALARFGSPFCRIHHLPQKGQTPPIPKDDYTA